MGEKLKTIVMDDAGDVAPLHCQRSLCSVARLSNSRGRMVAKPVPRKRHRPLEADRGVGAFTWLKIFTKGRAELRRPTESSRNAVCWYHIARRRTHPTRASWRRILQLRNTLSVGRCLPMDATKPVTYADTTFNITFVPHHIRLVIM